MRRNALLAAWVSAALAAGCQWAQRPPITGTVNIDPALLGRAQQPGAVLFVVARNQGGVPVAVREIVNPQFPCRFTLGPEDLVLPDAWNGEMRVTAQLASRLGADGLPVAEVEGAHPVSVTPGSEPVRVYIGAPKAVPWATARRPSLPEKAPTR